MALNYTVPAVDRAIRVLEILSSAQHGMSLAQLASQTKVPKSTMFRILHTLHEHSVIVEDKERKLFSLGMKLLGWGNAALSRIDLKTLAHQHLLKLAHETRESFYLALLDHDEVVLVDRADTPEIWKMVTRLGSRSPFHCTATGLVIAAAMTDEAVDEIIARHGLKKFTSKTITSASRLKKRLKDVRQLGYAVCDGEYKPDLCAIAVPLWDHTGKVMASLMTAIPSERSSKDKKLVDNLVTILKQEAEQISKHIGFEGVASPE
ncbi:MAG TPA: IclR family transcriptional regulator [Bacteroidota bacterium]|nr:IclR family transcriptional regulator [Bacteroidota bacterium]